MRAAPIPAFSPPDLITATTVQEGDLVAVMGTIVPGPIGWSDPWAGESEGFWITTMHPFGTEPFVRVLAEAPKGFQVVMAFGRVHWWNGRATLADAEVRFWGHSYEWWRQHRYERPEPRREGGAGPSRVGPSATLMMESSDGMIGSAKGLPDGPLPAEGLPEKVVAADTNQFAACIYIQEPLRSSGIRVYLAQSDVYNVGDIVTVSSGTMATVDGERVILNAAVSKGEGQSAPVPLWVQNRTVCGGEFGQQGAVLDDSTQGEPLHSEQKNNVGLLVQTWGLVTYADPAGDFIYIDDGSLLKDGNTLGPSNAPVAGVRVAAAGTPLRNKIYLPNAVGEHALITGAASCMVLSGRTVRCLRPRSQADVRGLRVVITSPTAGSTVTRARNPSGTDVPIVGKVFGGFGTLQGVWVSYDGEQTWEAATVVGDTWTKSGHVFPAGQHEVWAKAVDTRSDGSDESKESVTFTVAVKSVVYVKHGGAGNQDGSSWANAKPTISSGIAAASVGYDVWVAGGTYTESVSLASNVGVYGGFAGNESYREQRNPGANATAIRGHQALFGTATAYGVHGFALAGFAVTDTSGQGPGIRVQDSSGTVSDCVITGNSHYAGGGVYVSDSPANSTVSLVGNIIMGNDAPYGDGGGVYAEAAAVVLQGNSITSNSTDAGGGVYAVAGSAVSMADNVVASNVAGSGGGIAVDEGSALVSTNDTIAVNSASAYGGGLLLGGQGSSLHVVNAIVAFNRAPEASCLWGASGSTLTVTYSDLYGSAPLFAGFDPLDPAHPEWQNKSVNPVFAAPHQADYHLANGSPCIDAGNNSAPGLPVTDIEGDPRICSGRVDMGADEWTHDMPARPQEGVWLLDGTVWSSPACADLDGNPANGKEIVIATTDSICAYHADGSVLWRRVNALDPAKGWLRVRSSGLATPAVADINEDGILEVVVGCDSWDENNRGRMYVFAGPTGNALPAWHPSLGEEEGCVAQGNPRYPYYNAPAIANTVSGSPYPSPGLEIVSADESCWLDLWNTAGWRGPHTQYGEIILSSPALADLDGNMAAIEGAVGFYGYYGWPPGAVQLFRGADLGVFTGPPNGQLLTQAPVYSSPAIGVFHDGDTAGVTACDTDGNLYIWRNVAGPNPPVVVVNIGGTMSQTEITSSPALADLDGAGDPEIVIGSLNGRLYAFHYDGTPVTGWSGGILLDGSPIQSSPAIGDIDGDSLPEIVVGTNGGHLYAIERDGTGVPGWPRSCIPWPLQTASLKSTPLIDDVDGDGKVEVVAASSEAIFKFDLDAPYNPARMPWPTFHVNNQRTGKAQ